MAGTEDIESYEEEIVQRKVIRRSIRIQETSSTTKTTTLSTPAKLYGKDLSEYEEIDVEALLAQLSPEEINILAKEVDPDDSFLPPNQRCSYECEKEATGPLDRKKLIDHINKQALETPDRPELEPYVAGTVRGKKWIPPPKEIKEQDAEEQIAIDLGDEYETALSDATQEEIIDLAAILGFHSMMNQDQYHASLLNKGQPVGLGWDGITKATQQKLYPMDPPNNTDIDESIKRVKDDDPKLIELNLNNIKNISDEKFEQLVDALPGNEHLEVLSLTNVGLTDKTALLLAEAIEKSKSLRVVNVETNFISPPVVVALVKALLKAKTIEEFRASNQRSSVLGNKIEMEITELVEKNTSLLRLGLHLEYNDARHRIASHLQRNIDRIVRVEKVKPNLPKLIIPPANMELPPGSIIERIKLPSPPPRLIQIPTMPSALPEITHDDVDDFDAEIDPDNVVIRGVLTPSPTPSPVPPEIIEDPEFDPDNVVIRGHPSPTPSPVPPETNQDDVDFDPDNVVIRGHPSPTPSPVPPETNKEDIDIDPDNVVIRGSDIDPDIDEDKVVIPGNRDVDNSQEENHHVSEAPSADITQNTWASTESGSFHTKLHHWTLAIIEASNFPHSFSSLEKRSENFETKEQLINPFTVENTFNIDFPEVIQMFLSFPNMQQITNVTLF